MHAAREWGYPHGELTAGQELRTHLAREHGRHLDVLLGPQPEVLQDACCASVALQLGVDDSLDKLPTQIGN